MIMPILDMGRVAGSAAIIREGKILLLLRAATVSLFPDHWTFPSGGIEPSDENAFATVVREVKEETGLDFKPTQKFGFYESHAQGKRYFALVFLGVTDGEIRLQTSEITQAQFYTFDQAINLPLAFAYKEVLKDLKAKELM
jgi:8-oxo-dGTP pyrophosphatase MutT (NUDIX family)